MTQNELRKQIQSYRFAAHDMLLFLDTHPEDRRGFSIFKELTKRANELTAAYQAEYGPLTPPAAAEYDEFKWIYGPWPWEKGGNA